VGDARHILEKLIVEYRALEADSSRLGDWWKQIDAWREEYPLRYDDSSDSEIKPQYMVEAIYAATGGDAVIVSDVGQHQMWAAQYYTSTTPGNGSTRAAWARWASACPQRWALRSGARTPSCARSAATARSR